MTEVSPDEGIKDEYRLVIARRTIDKLGVKLYDRISAVVAELVANAYDADSELVTVRVPISRTLAKKGDDGSPVDLGFIVEVVDTGHGMTPEEAKTFFLRVGTDRRENPSQGPVSREKSRPVMGRKGIGKLAPFGVCRKIEVLSAGGNRTESGYEVSHFFLDYDEIISDEEEPVVLRRGNLDRTFADSRGTTIRMSNFLRKRVPDGPTLKRQIARRFGPTVALPDFSVVIEDTEGEWAEDGVVAQIHIPLMNDTLIEADDRPVTFEDGTSVPVAGWLAFAREAYKTEEDTGVAIYARGKIVATTRDFEQASGYTGEFMARSYLVGEIHADWLDSDSGEDLIRTDRQGIIWDSEPGRALREWGAALIREVALKARNPRRIKVSALFIERSGIEDKARDRYADADVVDTVLSLAKQFGAFAAEDELNDQDYVDGLAEVILSVAPHRALIQAYKEFSLEELGRSPSLDELLTLSGKTLVAELASYGQISAQRVRVIGELQEAIVSTSEEATLQKLLAQNPWLIEPSWSPVTRNQSLATVRDMLQIYLSNATGEDVVLAIESGRRRPDFTMIAVARRLHIVEIKTPGHTFDSADCRRLTTYLAAMHSFFDANATILDAFPDGWRLLLVADSVNISDPTCRVAFDASEMTGQLRRRTWTEFLERTRVAHEQFLEIRDAARRRTSESS